MSSPSLSTDGRTLRRLESMRRIQEAALDLFEGRGYSAVTVEEIAAAAGVGPATVYRSFVTKERVVLWDEYDPMLLENVEGQLKQKPLLVAIEAALITSLEAIYKSDKKRILRRSRLIFSEPSLIAAAALDTAALRAVFSERFFHSGAVKSSADAAVAAAICVSTLEASVGQWVAENGARPLGDVMRDAFRTLRDLVLSVEDLHSR